ncbi:hypothetical protein IWQ56_004895, partial [Coemansia nantahalensis]
FYTRSAFPDMSSEDYAVAAVAAAAADRGEGGGYYSADLDLDSASLALGVALSMEQQGYSKADVAAVAAAAAAAAGNPRDEYIPTTTITASMNANGEADPIDGIVSVKSSSGRPGSSRMATGTHTPYARSDWRMAAAAAAVANAYLDRPMSPTMSYVLPRDLNEARTPGMPLAVLPGDGDASAAGASSASSATMAPASVPPEDKDDGTSAPVPPRAARTLTSQLPNSSFYKPLSSISSSSTRTSGCDSATASAPATATYAGGGAPLVSLAEVNAALAAFSECQPTDAAASARPPAPKRKASQFGPQSTVSGADDKRARHAGQMHPPSLALSTLFELDDPPAANPTLAMGAGAPMATATPMRGRFYASDEGDGDDDWLRTMDQLVDTDALLVQSPPPSPADGVGSAADLARGLPFARWDRIPVNIFRRSRALASSRRVLALHDDSLAGPSSLAMTAIRSSRQRRALVSSTLLTQHTLSAEAALRHHELKLGLRAEHRSPRLREPSRTAAATAARYPPVPPGTPLGVADHAPTAPPRMLHRSTSQDAAPGGPRSKALRRVRTEHLRTRHRKLVSSGIVTDVGTPCDSPGPESDSSGAAVAAPEAEAEAEAGAADASDTGYAFDWLEDDEDL